MADPRKYAEWIVANADKKGTPEFDKVASAYAEARRLRNAAPIEAPAPVATPTESVTKPRYTVGEVPLEALSNIPSDAWRTGKDLAHFAGGVAASAMPQPVQYLLGKTDTGKELLEVVPTALKTVAGGAVNAGTATAGMLPGLDRKSLNDALSNKSDVLKSAIDNANAAGGHLADSYGGWEEIKRSLAERPVQTSLDIAALLGGGAGLARSAGKGLIKRADVGPLPNTVANRAATATGNALDTIGGAVNKGLDATGNAVGNAVGSAIKYPVNKLVDVAGWTFDTMTGKRVPVSTGVLARKVVGEGNLEASRNALREQVAPSAAPLEAVPESVNALNPSRPAAAAAAAEAQTAAQSSPRFNAAAEAQTMGAAAAQSSPKFNAAVDAVKTAAAKAASGQAALDMPSMEGVWTAAELRLAAERAALESGPVEGAIIREALNRPPATALPAPSNALVSQSLPDVAAKSGTIQSGDLAKRSTSPAMDDTIEGSLASSELARRNASPDVAAKSGTIQGGDLAKRSTSPAMDDTIEGSLASSALVKQGGASGHHAKADADLLEAIDAEFTNVTGMAPRTPVGVTAPQAIVGAGVNAPRVAALHPKLGDAAYQYKLQETQVADRAEQIRGQAPDLKAAIEARAEAAAPLWKAGDATSKPLSPELSHILEKTLNPSQWAKLKAYADAKGLDLGGVSALKGIHDYATGAPIYPKVSGQVLYNVKRLLDDVIANETLSNAAKIDQATAQAMLDRYKPALYRHIEEYGKAAKIHAEKSQPINQSIVMNHYANKLTNSLSDIKEGASGFVNLADKMDELPPSVKTALKQNDVRLTGKTVNDILSTEAKDALMNVADQLKRDQRMKEMSSAGGAAELKALTDSTKKIVDYAPLNVLYNVAVKVVNKVGLGVSEITKTRLLEAAKTPKDFLKVLDTLPASERLAVLRAIKDAKIEPGALAKPAAIGNALAPTQEENKNALTK